MTAAGAILHEFESPSRIPAANQVGDDELGIGVNGDPRPDIAPSVILLFDSDILALRADEGPDFVALEPLHPQMPHMLVVVPRTGRAEVGKQLEYRSLGRPRHAAGCPDRAAFDEAVNDSGTGIGIQAVHIDYYAKAALVCQQESTARL